MSLLWRTPEEREERELMSFYRPWYRRPLVWLLLMVPLLIVARLALTPLVWHQTRKALAELPEYDVSFSSMSLALLGKQIVFRNVQVHHKGEAAVDANALATIPFVQVEMPLSRLLRGGAIDRVVLIEPVFRLRTQPNLAASPQARQAWLSAVERSPLREIGSLRIQRGTVLSEEQGKGPLVANDHALVRDLDASIKGLGLSRQSRSEVIEAKINGGTFLGSGIVTGQADFVPDGAHSWDFEGELFVAGLDLQDLHGHALAPARPEGDLPRGRLRVKATFAGKQGQLTAELQPEVAIDGARTFTVEELASLETKAARTTGMTVWMEGNKLQAALPATMAPIRFAAVVPAVVLHAAAHALVPPPAQPACDPAVAQEGGAADPAACPPGATTPGNVTGEASPEAALE